MQEVTQSRHTHDTAPPSEAPSLNTLRVVSMSGAASHISDVVTTWENAGMKADGSEGGWWPRQLPGNAGLGYSAYFGRHVAWVL